MKVIATDVSKRYNLRLKELHRVAQPGEIFETTEDRFVYLNGNNPKGYKVVEWYQEPEIKVTEEMVMPEDLGTWAPGGCDQPEEVMSEPIKEEPVIEEPKVEETLIEEKPKKKRTTKKVTEAEETPTKKTRKKKEE